ncbi:MAG: NAD(P)/FAD-dependent oxidoreductase, partial [Pseudomonadota bacterium]|nr:NAD(P)/FAD-dependent oxidoreductase [Pseudomonadota bacterium]
MSYKRYIMAGSARSSVSDDGVFDAVIVGAGLGGVCMLNRLRSRGFSTRVFEAGGGIGGTWFWNRYPGARCDAPSMEYSYQFSEELQQDWNWSEKYATQPEILRYINHVADRFDLRPDIQLNTCVISATYDEADGRWSIKTDDGSRVSARFCIMATGVLSSLITPDIKGLDTFAGPIHYTGRWPQEGVDFNGLRVGIIGTGSSAVQSIPHIARHAEHLYVFQRTPNYSVPAHNAPIPAGVLEQIKADYRGFRERAKQMFFGMNLPINDASALAATPEERARQYEDHWAQGGFAFLGAYKDLLLDHDANDTAAEFVRAKIREKVRDSSVAEKLMPRSVLGCKRLCIDTDYYETYNRPNVTLVDISEAPIEAITPDGISTNGNVHALDMIVMATGFDAITGALLKIDICGKNGLTLREKWQAGPRAYLGLAIAGFPNMFTINGPGSPSVLGNNLAAIEQHVNWIVDSIECLRERDVACMEATEEAETAWA